uniref:DUF4806 domain-containing protein n=1 Tax=Echinostoma caproni TaxID=27848 RepID=A0A183B313_9TREM
LDSASANKENYRKIMDATLSCMHHLHAPEQVMDKVRTWFMYNWEQQKTFGKNRRTADVRSKGFSTLFSLSKQDFEEIMKNYPQAHQLLKKRSQRMLNRDKKKAKEAEKARRTREEKEDAELPEDEVVEVIPERPPTPRLMDTVVQVSHENGNDLEKGSA